MPAAVGPEKGRLAPTGDTDLKDMPVAVGESVDATVSVPCLQAHIYTLAVRQRIANGR
jgi:hypothetical protein